MSAPVKKPVKRKRPPRAAFRARYIPKNPQKYAGNPNNIICRSSWELHVCKFFDLSNAVIRWNSEEISIKYISPVDGKVHRYFPDYLVKYKDANGNVQSEIVEVKPLCESDARFAKSELHKARLQVNKAKWAAASAFAANNGMKFRVITEVSIFRDVKQNRVKKPKPTKGTVGPVKSQRAAVPRPRGRPKTNTL